MSGMSFVLREEARLERFGFWSFEGRHRFRHCAFAVSLRREAGKPEGALICIKDAKVHSRDTHRSSLGFRS